MKNHFIVIIISLLFISCKTEVKKENKYEDDIEVKNPEIAEDSKPKLTSTSESIAFANGFKNWDKIQEIKFTFNVDRDTLHYDRTWKWRPKENLVTLISQKDTITYNRASIDSSSQKADQGFINDKYWLLAPFNLSWDAASFTSEHSLKDIAPISGKEMQRLTIVYNNEGGYTPGDAYDFYFEGDFLIKEWVFREKNTKEPSLITTWEDYSDFNGIKIAKTHQRNEGNWKLYFTNIEVTTE
ncbi:hypothetical protein M0D21_20285 [Aquimarina sp. D1M17]|uniref:hypothetical protein n=1 Tax=Aquimarina acroporae TaxID=2937283 RepID=UPI0020BF7618|nr:hypothetical protein [Aquimarina acroporae]MCK8523927.1 hypothetical protein [Aquimarina acroporae]